MGVFSQVTAANVSAAEAGADKGAKITFLNRGVNDAMLGSEGADANAKWGARAMAQAKAGQLVFGKKF